MAFRVETHAAASDERIVVHHRTFCDECKALVHDTSVSAAIDRRAARRAHRCGGTP
jgi:hypothetical protein